ncbi:MAG: class I SAM-dependent methyltransferase [Candidatus Omnitrophica bacterium]|nr:class I SAM-dependent methyltransferase [Candidatus Omnitrophota bacterium]
MNKNPKLTKVAFPAKPLKSPFKFPDNNYFLNTGFYFAFKRIFNWKALRGQERLNKIFINERVVEIPFAIKHLSVLPVAVSILDIGCVESPMPLMGAGLGFRVTGYDFREYPYVHPNLTFKQGDICTMPFPDETFDAMVCLSTIEHLGIGFYKDPKMIEGADIRGVKEALRVLKYGGRLILSAPVGKKQMTKYQRVYDIASFNKLFQGNSILEQKFFVNSRPYEDSPNWWGEVNAGDVESIDDTSGATVAVGMAVALKKR